MIAYEHYRSKLLRKGLHSLAILGRYLRTTEQKELRLRARVEKRLSQATFYQWIASFNRRVQFRHQLFTASQYWSQGCQAKHFAMLRAHTYRQREQRYKYRNFFLVKCILELLKRSLPRDLQPRDASSYEEMFNRLICSRRLKHYNGMQVARTVHLFNMQV